MLVLSNLYNQQKQVATKEKKKLVKILIKGSQTWTFSFFAQML